MACITNHVAGCSRIKDRTETVLGRTHWMTSCVSLDKASVVLPLCALAWNRQGARWMTANRLAWVRHA